MTNMIKKVTVLYAIVLLFSCSHKNEPLLIARYKSEDNVLGGTTQFILERNNTFSYSVIPNDPLYSKSQIIKGKFFIKQDTIYFTENSRFKKAIIKNEELELIDNYFKVNIIENNTSIKPKSNKIDFDDFTFFTYTKVNYLAFKEGKNFDLNQEEINKLKWYIQNKMDNEKSSFKRHSKQSEYNKQCISIINNNNEKIVWVNCISKKNEIFTEHWKHQILRVHDGGENYFQLKVNLTKGTVFDFYVNGNG